jgi:hypothetical protein
MKRIQWQLSFILIFGILTAGCISPAPPLTPSPVPEAKSPAASKISMKVSPGNTLSNPLDMTQTVSKTRLKPGDRLRLMKGFSMTSYGKEFYRQSVSDQSLAALRDTGADWVAIIPSMKLENSKDTVLTATEDTPSDGALRHVIQEAHRLGFRVMLKPHVDPIDGSYRGEVGTNFTPTEWLTWFDHYQEMILHYASLAEEMQIDLFCVGTELDSAQLHEFYWRRMLVEIRNQYTGLLTYAANHGQEKQVLWWDAVDLIGVDAYYPLSLNPHPALREIEAAWQPRVQSLERLSKRWNKPIIFTEIGYASQEGSAAQPWSWTLGKIDLNGQANLYQAVFNTFLDQPWFKGIFWWSWDDSVYQGGACNREFTPKGKPAENVLRQAYGAKEVSLPSRVPDLPAYDPNPARVYSIFQDNFEPSVDPNWSWNAELFLVDQPVYEGQKSVKVHFWGSSGFSPHLPGVNTTGYSWIEFYLYSLVENPVLYIFATDANDVTLNSRLLEPCWYAEGGRIAPNTWTRIVVPLEHLNIANQVTQRISLNQWELQNPFTFYIDQMRLVGK